MSSNNATLIEVSEENDDALSVSFLEISVSVILTFVPFLFVSIPILVTQGTNPHPGFFLRLFQFFSAGEIVLPIFSVCGAMYAVVALNNRRFTRLQIIKPIFLGLLAILFSGIVLGQTDGFTKAIGRETNVVLVIVYILMVLFWWRTLFLSKKTPETPPSADENANNLLTKVAIKQGQKK